MRIKHLLAKLLSSEEGGGGEGEGPVDGVVQLIIVVALMSLFVLVETFHEHKKFKFGHAASLVMLIGLGLSVLVYFLGVETESFSETAVFDYAIPIIVFNDGYNIRKQRFYKETANIKIFGVFVTFLTFGITFAALNAFLKLDQVAKVYEYNEEGHTW